MARSLRSKSLSLIISLVGLTALSGCGQNPPPSPAGKDGPPVAGPKDPVPPTNDPVWHASGGKHTLNLTPNPAPRDTRPVPKATPEQITLLKSLEAKEGFDFRSVSERGDRGYSISATGKLASDEFLKTISSVPCITSLYLTKGMITDEGLKAIGNLEFLETLQIDHCANITDAGLEVLARFGRLERLVVSGTKLTDAGMKHIGKVTSVGELFLSDSQGITDAGLGALADLKSLRCLSCSGTRLTGAGFKALIGLPWLATIYLGGQFDDAGAEVVAGLPRLDSLYVNETRLGDPGMKHLARSVTLTTLSAQRCPVSDEGLRAFSGNPRLGDLHLDGSKITGAGMNLPTLVRFSAEDTKFDDAGMESLQHSKNLQQLNLRNCPITDRGVTLLKGHPKLEELTLDGTSVTDEALKAIAPLPNLREIRFERTKVTDKGLEAICSSRGLLFVHASESGVTKDGAKAAKAKKEALVVFGSW